MNPLDLVIKGRESLSTSHVETFPGTDPIEQQYDYLQSIQGQLNIPSSWQTIQNILSTNSRIDLHHYFILFSQRVHGGIEPLLAKAPPEGLSRPSSSCSIIHHLYNIFIIISTIKFLTTASNFRFFGYTRIRSIIPTMKTIRNIKIDS